MLAERQDRARTAVDRAFYFSDRREQIENELCSYFVRSDARVHDRLYVTCVCVTWEYVCLSVCLSVCLIRVCEIRTRDNTCPCVCVRAYT